MTNASWHYPRESERANGQASGPVLTSQFLAFLTHRGREEKEKRIQRRKQKRKVRRCGLTLGTKSLTE